MYYLKNSIDLEIEVKSLWLKTSYILDTGPRESELWLT